MNTIKEMNSTGVCCITCYHIGEPRYSLAHRGDEIEFNFFVKGRVICGHIQPS